MPILTLTEFLASPHSLCIYHGDHLAFSSAASDLRGLVEYLDGATGRVDGITIFDRYVGRAAAMLFVLAHASLVYAGVVSAGGSQFLAENNIPLIADRTVPMLTDIASADMCRWEKLSFGRSPEELLSALRDAYR